MAIDDSVLKRWEKIAGIMGVHEEAYTPRVKIVADASGKNSFSFGVLLNLQRTERYKINPGNCGLCTAVERVEKDDGLNLFPGENIRDFIFVVNGFPYELGSSLAVTRKERRLYTTENLDGLADEFDAMFRFGDEKGFRVFHNGKGAGATIDWHEHYQPRNIEALFDITGESYGFEDAEVQQLPYAPGVGVIRDFPFFHAVFSPGDCEMIVYFLKMLHRHKELFSDKGHVPHVVCQGKQGILVVPMTYRDNGIGAADAAGHILCRSEEDFNNADYGYCMRRLQERLFDKDSFSLTMVL